MSTATATSTRPPASSHKKVTQARVLLSEWTKIRSLRSTIFSLLAAIVFIVGLAVLVPMVTVSHWPPRDPREALGFDPTTRTLSGIFLAQLAIGVLGVLLITGEYATGMIRATFAAVPARLPVLWAKAAVFAAVTLVLMVPTVLGAFLIGQSILTSKHLQTNLSNPGVLRAVIGAALFLTVVGLLGIGLGALLRNTAGGISTLFGLLFVLPIIVRFLPSSWSDPINKYLPSNAGEAITHVHPDPTLLAPWTGFGLFCGYAVVVFIAAAISLRRRDA
jgi:ABC-type transport system involved in multi-copper enzyme maturation permease subunit